ncbi:MAG: hypothetical protein EOM30_11435 [Clostridia bacterium]|nr:hypothetical protein [Clostridia bacterium]NLS84733.1 hypothetical protein [Oscillospiraceae bacterium]
MMKNWNVDEKKLREQQEKLKNEVNLQYVGHGPKATGFLSKTFKRKDGLYARCTQCGYYMPLFGKGSEDCICGSIHRDEANFKCDFGNNEVEIFKGTKK